MEDVLFAGGIVIVELGLAAILTWIIMLLRAEAKAPESESRLAELEREEEQLKKAA